MMKLAKSMCVAVAAAGLSVPLLWATGTLASLEIKQQGAVSFVSGGVGETEIQEIKALSSGFPVEMLFLAKSVPNRYAAGVKVQVKDKDGKVVLDTESEGPFLLAKLPPGKYSISADIEGNSKRHLIHVAGGKTQRVVFDWTLPVDQ